MPPLDCKQSLTGTAYEKDKVDKAVYNAVTATAAEWSAAGKLKARPADARFSVDTCAAKGRRPRMEDKHIVIEDLNSLLDLEDANESQAFFAVYDGHGGVEAASFAQAHLHHLLSKQESFSANPLAALKSAFLETDAQFIAKAEREALTCGATACAVLIRGSKLFVAWLGDSQCFLSRDNEAVSLMLAHKPEREDEKKRIEDSEGVVVWYGAWRVNGVLSVARAIGDAKLKKWVIGDPDVNEFDLDGDEQMLVLACDGVWDVLDYQGVLDFITKWRQDHDGETNGVAQALTDYCIEELNSTDNISVVIVFL